MTCKGFQYEEGKEYHEEEATVCEKGFHACEYPLDCFNYYTPVESVFHEVELGEDAHGDGNDTKKCSKSIKVGSRLDIAGIIKAAINYTTKNCIDGKSAGNRNAISGGNWSAISGGDQSALSGGDQSALSGGDRSVLRGGEECKYRGGLWSIFAAEIWDNGQLIGVKTAVVDGENIKPDTWYQFDGKEFIESNE